MIPFGVQSIDPPYLVLPRWAAADYDIISDYQDAIRTKRTHAMIVFPNQNITFTDDDILADGGITITEIMNGEIDFTIGKAYMRELTVEFIKTDKFDNFDWSEQCYLYFGVDMVHNNETVTVYQMVGVFKGKKPKRTVRANVITYIAYDKMQDLEDLADDFLDSLQFPITFNDFSIALNNYIGLYVGVPFTINGIVNYENINENTFPRGITLRKLLALYAEFGCTNIYIECYGNIGFKHFQNFTSGNKIYTITEDQHDYIDMDEDLVPAIDSVEIIDTKNPSHNIKYPADGTNPYKVIDNPFFQAIDGRLIIPIINAFLQEFTKLGSYYPAKLTTNLGDYLVETGDIINVQYDGNKTLIFPIFNKILVWNGYVHTEYECTGNSTRESVSASDTVKYKESNKKDIQAVVDDPTASGTDIQFISGITQDEQGVIEPLKKTVRTFGAASSGSAGTTGVVPAPASGKQKAYLRGDCSWIVPEIKSYTKSYSNLASGDSITFTAAQMGFSTPSGKSPYALARFNTGSSSCYARGVDACATGSENAITIINNSNSAKSGTVTIDVFYM